MGKFILPAVSIFERVISRRGVRPGHLFLVTWPDVAPPPR